MIARADGQEKANKEQERQIIEQMGVLDSALKVTCQNVDTLATRLAIIMSAGRPQPETGSTKQEPQAVLCDLAQSIVEKTNMVESMRDRILEILRRLEI
jgi:hypothetical protein